MDETTGSAHDLLLALAGRLDDDMLAWARELVAVGEDTRAVELVTAALAADATAVPAPLRAAIVDAARAARTDLDADAALPAASTAHPEHRFTAAPASCDDRVAQAVAALPARLLDGAEVLLTWRLTPAGGAPGPLPHPVVIVEVEPAGRPADVLAYQLSVGLDRAGVVASVEVLTGGRPLSDYHAAARREARRVDGSAAETTVTEPEPEPPAAEPPVTRSAFAEPAFPEPALAEQALAEPVPEPALPEAEPAAPERTGSWPAGLFGVSDEPLEPDATATDPIGDVVGDVRDDGVEPAAAPRSLPRRAGRDIDPEPRPAPRPLERRRTTVTPLSRAFLPGPLPPARRDGGRARPLAPVADEQGSAPEATAYSPSEQGQIPALADTPTFRSMQDPLSGPLNAPLLAPLLDPTAQSGADDENDLSRDDPSHDDGVDDDPFGPGGISPLAPDRPAPAAARPPVEDPPPVAAALPVEDPPTVEDPPRLEDQWADEWASGDWAVSPQDMASTGESDLGAPAQGPPRRSVDEPRTETEERPRQWESLDSPADPPTPAPVPPATPPPLAVAAPRNPSPPEPPVVGPPRPGPDRGPARPPAAERVEPVQEQVTDGLGLRPDSVARLSDADRELLARLQSELGAGTRARTSRRAGLARPASNGNGRVDPPDPTG